MRRGDGKKKKFRERMITYHQDHGKRSQSVCVQLWHPQCKFDLSFRLLPFFSFFFFFFFFFLEEEKGKGMDCE